MSARNTTYDSLNPPQDPQLEWDPPAPVPTGGPLPIHPKTHKQLTVVKATGSGTKIDPKVMWISGRELREARLRGRDKVVAYEEFAKLAAREIGLTHVWIRKGMHNVEITRDDITFMKTGLEETQDHLTVYVGTKDDWINLHGHFFAISDNDDDDEDDDDDDGNSEEEDSWRSESQKKLVYKTMPVSQRIFKVRLGHQGRSPELWKYDPLQKAAAAQRARKLWGLQSWR